jgi:hypothetical protein
MRASAEAEVASGWRGLDHRATDRRNRSYSAPAAAAAQIEAGGERGVAATHWEGGMVPGSRGGPQSLLRLRRNRILCSQVE